MTSRTTCSCSIRLAGVVFLLAFPAFGGVVSPPDWIVNTPEAVIVDFHVGRITQLENHFVGPFQSPAIPPPGGGAAVSFWQVSARMDEEVLGGVGRVSVLTCDVQHIVGPHGEGPGPVGPPCFFQITSPVTGSGVITSSSAPFIGSHDATTQHFDVLLANIAVFFNEGQITGYTLTLSGQHFVPEPSTLAMLGLGLLLVLLGSGGRMSRIAF